MDIHLYISDLPVNATILTWLLYTVLWSAKMRREEPSPSLVPSPSLSPSPSLPPSFPPFLFSLSPSTLLFLASYASVLSFSFFSFSFYSSVPCLLR